MSDTLRLDTALEQGVFILRPSGELTWQTASTLRAWLEGYAPAPAPITVIDLSAITFLDSTGISALLGIHTLLGGAGAGLAYAEPPPMCARLLHITGLARYLPVYDTVQSARLAAGTRAPFAGEHPA
ncbi:STAS domain-containing protein [Nonomuraea dietziae]|uniref:Anti-sigma factor antagonist n=1 Tax=Nonomuraea dietziae TaxID=65515 RepID=A0A7W5V779_9ACTN|nr:STAS domain-containing protein [Nonomuraea dietziae]MBB3731821.1 anti-anti-sigma factor [Nonomuraea dietziae]